MTEGTALRLRGVTVRFGERTALQEVDLDVPRGQFLALTGPNGSGKTTLLRAALGFLAPDTGTVEVFGNDVLELSIAERARRVAWVPQEENPRDDAPLFDYVLYGRYAHLGWLQGESASDRDAALRALRAVGLEDRARDGILSVSGGERQRAILARALVQEAPLVLLDEPTSHLDIAHQIDLLTRVRELSRERGVTIVAALHDLNLAARFSDRIVVLSRGRRVADGTPSAVLSEELLARVWGVVADLRRDPRTGTPYLLPHHLVAPPATGPSALLGRGPVHVIGGGGSAAPYLRALAEAGYRVTAGALHLLDTDLETAESLGALTAVEVPFAPIGEEARRRLRTLLDAATAVVVAPFPVGPSNLPNLEEVGRVLGRVPVLLVRRPPDEEWDFSGGRARALEEKLRRGGAREVAGVSEMLSALAAGPLAPSA
ncbi:MAG TPA: ABC transporter ATP-binding protein [Thermoplasmata archaeon]|nr:ABC transporter ATP-binding protein [Thermoplasmata archaeon]